MPAFIHDIVTANPDTYTEQSVIRDLIKDKLSNDRKTSAIIHRIYSQSGIDKRHIVLGGIDDQSESSFFNRALHKDTLPGTEERNDFYKTEATNLFLQVGRQLLERNPQFSTTDITHVITVSCTGFYAPGPDFELVRGLGLSPSTQRFHIGFMGCYAAFPALKMAQAFCESDPNATVLVICTEICTLHFQFKNDLDNLVASSVFADGSAGVIVSSKEPQNIGYRLEQFESSLAYEGEQDMAWTIGDTGFNMVLSSYVPQIIAANLEDVIKPLFAKLSVNASDIDYWAVHPGGRAIVDKVEQAMELSEVQVQASRSILKNYGNMSSATVLFVMKELLEAKLEAGTTVLPIGFGPGLTIETGLLTIVNG